MNFLVSLAYGLSVTMVTSPLAMGNRLICSHLVWLFHNYLVNNKVDK